MGWRTAIASVLCGLLTVALLVSYRLDPWKACLGLTPDFYVGVLDGDLWFCSTELPYHGSMLQIDGDPPILRESGLDLPGVYYRSFRFPAGTLWSLGVDLRYLILPLVVFPSVWFIRRCLAERRLLKERTGRA
jgi:hypothetical protein